RGHVVGVDGGDYDRRVGDTRGVPAVAPDDPEDRGAVLARGVDRVDDVRRDVALEVAAAHREDEDRVVGVDPAPAQPLREAGGPTLVVRPGRQLGDVV